MNCLGETSSIRISAQWNFRGRRSLYRIAENVHNEFTTVKRIYNEKQVPHTL
jgi:hypothetical protein